MALGDPASPSAKVRARPDASGFQSSPTATSMSPPVAAAVTRPWSIIATAVPDFAIALMLRGMRTSTAVVGGLAAGTLTSARPDDKRRVHVRVLGWLAVPSLIGIAPVKVAWLPGARRTIAPPGSA